MSIQNVRNSIVNLSVDIQQPSSFTKKQNVASLIDFNPLEVRPIAQSNILFPVGISGHNNSSIPPTENRIHKKNYYNQNILTDFEVLAGDGLTTSIETKIDFSFASGMPPGESQLVFAGGFDSIEYGLPVLDNHLKIAQPVAIQSAAVIGAPKLLLMRAYVSTVGISQSAYGLTSVMNLHTFITARSLEGTFAAGVASIVNRNRHIYPPSAVLSYQFGISYTYNLKQFVALYGNGFLSSRIGRPYLIGGRKWLYATGLDASKFGDTDLLNTTANKYARPQGISQSVVPAATVSPRMLYPTGISSLVMSKVHDVRTPLLLPDGIDSNTAVGIQTVWFHTRPISLTGIQSYSSGFSRVADPTQFVQAQSLITSAIFGDTATRNLSFKVFAPSVYDGSFSDYSTLTNTNRYYSAKGFLSQAIGTAEVVNKTPSIFVRPTISPYGVATPRISNWIGILAPIGIDSQLIGSVTVIKTPELFPQGHTDSVVSKPIVWYKNREVKPSGPNTSLYGKPQLWFRYRYATPVAWRSSVFASPTLTHGVRELIIRGFRQDVLGTSWVSQGTRRLEPVSIHRVSSTNHMVGYSRSINAHGFIATEFGSRITPIPQSLYPSGFAEQWGLPLFDLQTKYVYLQGFISVGQQPADRWGVITAYNLTQYVQQDYDGSSGLAPPKWSDWQSVENRNKSIGAVGFLSQKFGYAKIDNNAAQLSPLGVEPPQSDRFNLNMIAHAIRPIPIEGIESLVMGSWGVVYNGARVITPVGRIHTSAGEHSLVNTRRYYRDWGRIDSLEMGLPAIGYRIRTIDIEPRYSIAPPQIDLPTVFLYTRYATFRGYETAAYGLPSLIERFNIIATRWSHQERTGYPDVKNNTPELGVYGHDSSEFGVAATRTQWRDVMAQGANATLFGLAHIADTKRTITVRGWLDSTTSQLPKVIKMGTNPYMPQNIWLHNESGSGGSSGIASGAVGRPWLNQNVLYHRSEKPSQEFGTAFVWGNNLYVSVGIAIDNVGRNHSIENKIKTIGVPSLPFSESFGKPRMSPYTIWARTDTPAQAQTNHSTGSPVFHEVDYYTFLGKPQTSRAYVESTIRYIEPQGFDHPTRYYVGQDVFVALKRRYIQPRSFRWSAFGLPEIPFTLKTIKLNSGINNAAYGYPATTRPPYIGPQSIYTGGVNSFRSGNTTTDLFIRHLKVSGRDSLSMGRSESWDTPYMWQTLRVGERVPLVIGGGDMSVFGTTYIGLRVRDVTLNGFDSFRSEYELSRFSERMKVTGETTNYVPNQSIEVDGIHHSSIGKNKVNLAQHYIRPDGNSDQFRKGGYYA